MSVNLIGIGVCLFSFVMSAVVLAGYLLVLKPSGEVGGAARGEARGEVQGEARGALLGLLRSIGDRFPAAQKENNPDRKRLQMAGYRWPGAIGVFYGIKCGSALLLAAALGLMAVLAALPGFPLLPMACGAAIGFVAPNAALGWIARRRAQRLRAGLPPALDLMILGIESGQSIDYAIADASRGLQATHAELSQELTHLQLELRAGASRAESFRNFAERNKEPEIRKLCGVFIDSDRFGAALGPSLRTHVKYLRTRFRQQAQQAARKAGVKLIFPVFFLIFPSVLLVTLGPACIIMYQQLRSMLA